MAAFLDAIFAACAGPRQVLESCATRAKYTAAKTPMGTFLRPTSVRRNSVVFECGEYGQTHNHNHQGADCEELFYHSGGTHASFHFLEKVLKDHFLFSGLGEETIRKIIPYMERSALPARTPVYQQGDEGEHFYVCETGKLVVLLNGNKIKTISPGECFAHQSLTYDNQLENSVTTEADSVLYRLSRNNFRKVLSENQNISAVLAENDIVELGSCPIFANMSPLDLHTKVAPFFKRQDFPTKDPIFSQGDESHAMYIIKSGRVNLVQRRGISNRADVLTRPPLKSGDYFGEGAMWGALRNTSAVPVNGSVQCWAMERMDPGMMPPWLKSLMPRLQTEFNVRSLLLVPLFQTLLPATVKQLAAAMKEVQFKAGDVIFKYRDEADSFYLIKSGKVQCSCPSTHHEGEFVTVASYTAGDYFGMSELLDDTPLRHMTITAMEPTSLFRLEQDEFRRLLGPLRDTLIKESNARKELYASISSKPLLDDFEFKQILAKSRFSTIWLVTLRRNGKKYAMKVIDKNTAARKEVMKQIKQEFSTMCTLEFQFICRGLWTIQNASNIAMVSEWANGGELKDATHLLAGAPSGRLLQDQAQFYVIQVILALEHLHENGIIFRDLRPENVLLDADGYCELVNFGLSKDIGMSDRTLTICGIPEYMSPEMIQGLGYSFAHDFWTLGVFVYELLVGHTPFHAAADRLDIASPDLSPAENATIAAGWVGVQEKIMRGKYKFPADVRAQSSDAYDLIEKLLVVDKKKRLGTENGWEEVRRHRWFSGIDFKAYISRRVPAPYDPIVQNVNRKNITSPRDLSSDPYEGKPDAFEWIENTWT